MLLLWNIFSEVWSTSCNNHFNTHLLDYFTHSLTRWRIAMACYVSDYRSWTHYRASSTPHWRPSTPYTTQVWWPVIGQYHDLLAWMGITLDQRVWVWVWILVACQVDCRHLGSEAWALIRRTNIYHLLFLLITKNGYNQRSEIFNCYCCYIPYFFYIFDHLKIIIFFADRKIVITPKLTENLEPNTNSIPDAPVHVCILIVKVRKCRTHITWVTCVTFGYNRVSFYDIRIKLFPFSFILKKTIAGE